MTVDADLLCLMKRLKLGPLAPTLPERLSVDRAQQLVRCLPYTPADEVQRRDHLSLEHRLAQAGFAEYVTLDEFDWPVPVQLDRRKACKPSSLSASSPVGNTCCSWGRSR